MCNNQYAVVKSVTSNFLSLNRCIKFCLIPSYWSSKFIGTIFRDCAAFLKAKQRDDALGFKRGLGSRQHAYARMTWDYPFGQHKGFSLRSEICRTLIIQVGCIHARTINTVNITGSLNHHNALTSQRNALL